MLTLALVLLLSASVFSESVRETETWMPMKTTQTAAMSTHTESSGDSPNGSDFGFTDNNDDDEEYGVNDGENVDYDDEYYDDEDEVEENEDEYEFSGSGDGATAATPGRESEPSVKPGVNDNKIPEVERPTVNEVDILRDTNEILLLGNKAQTEEELPSNVLMAHASEDSIFNKTEVLAALIAGGAVGLMLAVLLILLLIYRMKKKDEGSYELGKKPIYKKAPTTEIYA
ncbi:syndecan-4 isoform X2 [Pseudochaenichthys georgianus]|uniref:syndecan-4 isoform X2 n=1 Tax=Pseudochaenichthys georgianus TaxID=52239 RepID=UPI00146C23A5|nr:syndecan-4 isoform X2 [Pseudochaenichthys georgianus]